MARARGIPVVCTYIDDFLLQGASAAACASALSRFLALLRQLGIAYGPEKISGPGQVVTFLGFRVDTLRAEISMDPSKATKLRVAVSAAAATPKSLAWLESLAGRLAWFSSVAANIRPELSAVYSCISAARQHGHASLEHAAATRLHAAITLASQSPEPIWCWRAPRPSVLLRTDASGDVGYGGHVGLRAFARAWRPSWASCRSMTARELWPAAEALRLWPFLFRHRVAVIAMDNSSAVFALCRFSSQCPRARRIIRLIISRCRALHCSIVPCHLPRLHNTVADALSRFPFSWSGSIPHSHADSRGTMAVSHAVDALTQLRHGAAVRRVLPRPRSSTVAPIGG